MEIASVVVDFDGTAAAHDVAEHLLTAFARDDWRTIDDAWERGELGSRMVVDAQDRMLDADRDTLLDFARRHCGLDPTFAPFVRWALDGGIEVTIASDGFGFYIEPLLAAAGVPPIPVIANEQRWDARARPAGLGFPNGHPDCIGCGTCKMRAVIDRRAEGRAVAFVGEGGSDRYGALYADVTFAKLALVDHCERDGVAYVPWRDFDDVRAWIDSGAAPPGPRNPPVCPGWTAA